MERESAHASAGVVAALVGYTSSFAVVLTGLRAVGATSDQASSGLLVLCVAQTVGIMWLARRYRRPLVLVWSTPGAALLASTGTVDGGWAAAVGAFVLAGLLYGLTGLWPLLGRLISRIPPPIAQAMLAGVVLELCLAPVISVADQPGAILPIVVAWLVGVRFFARWAVPVAFVVAGLVIGVDLVRRGEAIAGSRLLPHLELTTPDLTWAAIVGIAIPLYVVTMASQNVPGVAIMRSYEYEVPWRASMVTAGVGTTVGAVAGGHSINLAAISAALVAGPEGGPDPKQRWRTAQWAGIAYFVLGLASAAVAALVAVAPVGVIETVAGLALLGTLIAALKATVDRTDTREAALVTFLVAASGITVAGVGSAFWAIVAGLVIHLALSRRPV
ncbi:MAG: benzoate/H(+) symporter BenE family transporter [Aeromicrobium sp.]|uniref:benzoate/H(+) symporter BenE family transporter n=1 Tax=Aeromicrobium sp. TaxID=1871063 RepID=UPI003C363139